MTVPYEPRLKYLYEDPECCDNGCPVVTCRVCGQDWPCPDFIAAHTDTQVLAQVRYVARKKFPGDPDQVEYETRIWKRPTIMKPGR
jgi:hypothetical protein